jgi:lipoprotein-anchoring transpeptidase ErfK/SrfK
LTIGVVIAFLVGGGFWASPALAYTEEIVSRYNDSPWFTFDKNPSNSLNSKLIAYISVNGTRYRIEQRAGSGTGSRDTCERGRGWLPNGAYSNNDDHSRSFFKHYNKTWGEEVVRGWVWELGDRQCHEGTWRTELFIHSQGASGWSGNYASNGCIKINQTDRSHLHNRFNAAYARSDGFLNVVS